VARRARWRGGAGAVARRRGDRRRLNPKGGRNDPEKQSSRASIDLGND
jgi:hypothetical protein